MGFRPRELSHFSDNAGCGLSVSIRFPLRGSGPIPTACRPCRSIGFWPTECDPPRAFGPPAYSLRSAMPSRIPFAPYPLQGKVLSGPARHRRRCHSPLLAPACPAAPEVATRTVKRLPPMAGLPPPARPNNTQAAYCRSRSRLPLAVAVWVVTRRRGLSDRPHLARPSQTYLPCGRPPSGRVAVTFLLHPYRLSPWECTARPGRAGQPSSPDDPWSGPPGGRTPRAAPSLRGRVGLLGQTPFAGGGCPRDGEYPLTGVTPGYP